MKKSLKTRISNHLEQSIDDYLTNKEVNTFHVLDKIFPVERRVRSIIGGLETSFGTKLWEYLAKELATENGFEIFDNKNFLMPAHIPIRISSIKTKWETKRLLENNSISLKNYIDELKKQAEKTAGKTIKYKKPTSGKGIDLWLKKNNREYIFDIKTNQINKNGANSLNSNLMDWYAYRILDKHNVNIKIRIAFPFNPYIGKTWWEVNGTKAYPLRPREDVLVEDEFWDFLHGKKNTWKNIIDIFDKLGKKIGKKYEGVFYE